MSADTEALNAHLEGLHDRAVAAAAVATDTWTVDDDDDEYADVRCRQGLDIVATDTFRPVAQHIAELDPKTVLQLVESMRTMHVQLEAVKALNERWRAEAAERGQGDTAYTAGVVAMLDRALKVETQP